MVLSYIFIPIFYWFAILIVWFIPTIWCPVYNTFIAAIISVIVIVAVIGTITAIITIIIAIIAIDP